MGFQCACGRSASLLAYEEARDGFETLSLLLLTRGTFQWLRPADKAKMLQQTQLMLIIDNIGLNLSPQSQVYENVISIWTKAMMTMDSLVSGIAHSVQSPEIFLGLSAWHLYPDMSVLSAQTTYIEQKHNLIIKGGHITIGKQTTDREIGQGLTWSMPLASLRYYGKPVTSKRSIGSGTIRVPFRRIVQIALGSAISGWKTNADDLDSVCYFLKSLSMVVNQDTHMTGDGLAKNWVALLGQEANEYLNENASDRKESSRYIEKASEV
jgi:hypothetical protein